MNKNEFVTARTKIISDMLDNPDKHEIYPTTEAFAKFDDLFDEITGETTLSGAQKLVEGKRDDYGNDIRAEKKSPNCAYGSDGYPDCHCNSCIDEIQELNGIKKGSIYLNKLINQKVRVTSFCPLPNCMDISWRAIDDCGLQHGQCMTKDLIVP